MSHASRPQCARSGVGHALPAFLLALLVLLLLSVPALAQTAPEPGQPAVWTEPDHEGGALVHLYVFHSLTCPHCREAMPFIEQMAAETPWLRLHSMELSQNRANGERYVRFAEAMGQEAMYVPAFFYCGQMVSGYDTAEGMGAAIRADLEACHAEALARYGAPTAANAELLAGVSGVVDAPGAGEGAGAATDGAGAVVAGAAGAGAAGAGAQGAAENAGAALAQESLPAVAAAGVAATAPTVALPFVGEVSAASLSLPALTVVLAGLDAFNPCAFFVLMFLLSLMVHARNRTRMLIIGLVFVLFSALIYFVFMAAWLNVFLLVGELAIITLIAGIVAIIFGAINVKDFFAFKQGVSLSIPEGAKPGLFARMRKLVSADSMPTMIGSTILLAIAANSYELLCTAGFPMVYTRALTLHDLPTAAFYGYLAAYNLIYIIPLVAIVVLFAVRFGSRKLSEREGRVLKLLSGLMMLMLGGLLVFLPAALSNPLTAIGLLVAAILLTWLIVFIDKRRADAKSPGGGSRPHATAAK